MEGQVEMETDSSCTTKERTIDEINEILQLAKLSENDILPQSQIIYFASDNLHNNNYKLLEMDSHLVQILEEGKSLYIKGGSNENVVICSDTQTYDVMETEISDSLLLVENVQFKDNLTIQIRAISKVTISGIFYNYLQPSVSRPYLHKLNNLLKKGSYKGPEFESQIDSQDLFTYDELLGEIQSSKKEFDSALEALHVFKMNSKIRLLNLEYHIRILSYMIKLIDENSWNLDEIDYDETISALSELAPVLVLNALLDKYTVKSKVIDGLQLYRYKETDVCAFLARGILLQGGMNYSQFFELWRSTVAEGMEPTEEMLYGIAIVDRTIEPSVVWPFTEESLPENINECFRVLFKKKEKWTMPEITPYIRPLTTDKMDVGALLAKYARASTTGGVKYYSAKHAK